MTATRKRTLKKTTSPSKEGRVVTGDAVAFQVVPTRCCAPDGCGEVLTYDPDKPSEIHTNPQGRTGGMVGHKPNCKWHKRIKEGLRKSHEQWTRIGEEVAERRRLEFEKLKAKQEAEGNTPKQRREALRAEQLAADETLQQKLRDKGKCKNGHDAVENGQFDSRGSFVCRVCKAEAAERHKAKKKEAK